MSDLEKMTSSVQTLLKKPLLEAVYTDIWLGNNFG